jgi:type I restriction enzyme S subunit
MRSNSAIIASFLVAYLNSRFGQDHILRHASGMVQQGLSLEKVRQIPVPLLSVAFQQSLEMKIAAALKLRRLADNIEKESEDTLLLALGLKIWNPEYPLTYTSSYKKICVHKRWDAQFYRPATDSLKEKLSEHFYLSDLCSQVTKGRSIS